jgi:hypothetical protein
MSRCARLRLKACHLQLMGLGTGVLLVFMSQAFQLQIMVPIRRPNHGPYLLEDYFGHNEPFSL